MQFTRLSVMSIFVLLLVIACGSSYAQAPNIASVTPGQNGKNFAILSNESITSDFVLSAENAPAIITRVNIMNNYEVASREDSCCCNTPGDANNDGGVNILDVTYIIYYLYKDGPYFTCPAEADATGNCGINILDVTRIIGYLYKDGLPPICPSTACDLCFP